MSDTAGHPHQDVPWDTATDHVEHLLEELDLPDETADRAEELAARYGGVDAEMHVGATPPSIAAGAVYCASLETNFCVTQAEIADAADISPPAVRNGWQPIGEREFGQGGDDHEQSELPEGLLDRFLRSLTGGEQS